MRLLTSSIAWLLALGLIHTANAKGDCSQKCSGVQSRFKYGKGTSYTYNYESQTKVQLVGNSKNTPNVKLKATVTISALDACDFALQLTNVKIDGPTAAQVGFDLAKDLEKTPLAFGFDNGAVHGICPEESESHDVLNIKRAILSAFQIANDFDAEDSYEMDISGNCPTKTSKQEAGDTVSVTKTKDLQACRDHISMYTSVRRVPYTAISKIQSTPFMKATQECKYKIKQNILNEVSCDEKHHLITFGDQKTGAGLVATVTSQLKFAQQGKASVTVKEGKKQPLAFHDHHLIWKESKEAAAKARKTLKILCDSASKDVRPETPPHFVEFVHQLKSVTLDDLRAIAKEAKGATPCPKAPSIFVDAVAQCGTAPCVTLVTQLLTSKSSPDLPPLSPIQVKLLLINLAFTAHPTKAGVVTVSKVLNDLPAGGLYAAASFVNAYCNLHENCQEHAEAKEFAKKYAALLSKVSPSKKAKDNSKNLEVLRAFGNLGHFSDGIPERLKIVNADAHNDIRLAAIQSLRRAPCTDDLENSLFKIFTDDSQDAEIRLNVFLVLNQRCASKELTSRLVNATNQIEFNQIGSFVQSYFKAMRNSKDPSKDKDAYSKAFLNRKFPSLSYRHSHFCEMSHFNYKSNIGYHADTAMIFTPDAKFPKQAFLNLTLDLFGQEINVFELGLRTEFLDEAADLIFGPEGYLTNAAGFSNKEDRKVKIKDPKIAEFQNEYDKRRKPSSGLDLFGYVRVYGDEIGPFSDYGIPIIDRLQRLIKPAAVAKFLSKSQSTSLNVYRLPYDYHVNFPAISGFPLRASLNASMVLNLELSGKADLSDAPNGNAELNLVLKPSAAHHAANLFAVYVGTVKNGVRWTRVSHSSTAAGINFKYTGHEAVAAKLELPKDRQEIFHIDSRVYSLVNDVPVEEKGVEGNRGTGSACTPKKWSDRYGLKLCTNFAYPNSSSVPNSPYFPLTGPMNADLYVEKVDPKLQSYDLTASWKANKVGRDVLFLFDTPNTQVNRQTKLTVKYERQKLLDLEFKSPSNHITAKGTLEAAGADLTSAIISVGANGKVYEVKGRAKRTALPNNGRKYVFDGDVKGADKQAGKVKANIEIQPDTKFKVDGDVTQLFDKPITYKGGYEKNKATGKYGVEHDLRGPWGVNKVKGDVNFKSPFNLDYTFDIEQQIVPKDATPHKIGYTHKHTVDRGPKTLKVVANSKLTSSRFPAANTGYDLLIDKSGDKLQIKAKTTEGNSDGLVYEQVTNMKPNDYSTNAALKHAKAQVDEKFVVVYRNKLPKELETSFKWNSLSTKKDYEALATVKRPKAEGYEGDYNLVVKIPGSEYKATSAVKPGGQPGQLQTNTEIQYAPNKKISIKSTYKGSLGRDFDVQSNIKFPDADPIDFSETHKITPQGAKVTSAVKKAGKVLYDISLDLANVDANKKNIKARIQSPVQKTDVGFDGIYEKLPLACRVQGTVSRNQKEYSKADIIVPHTFKHHEEKQAKFGLLWDLGTPDSKEVDFNYKTTKAGPAIDHEANLKLKLAKADYKFEVKRRHSDGVATNFTIVKSNAPILQLNVGRTHRSPDRNSVRGNLDITLRTFAPMTPRDLRGVVTYEFAPKRYKAGLSLDDAAKKQRAGIDFDATLVPGGYDKSLSLIANENEAKLKNLYVRKNDGSREVKGSATLKDGSKKEQKTFAWSLSGNIKKFQGQLETPYPDAPKISVSADSAFEPNKKRGIYSLLCGKTKINAEYSADLADKYSLVNVSLDTSFEAVKKARYSVKQDSKSGMDLDFKFELNDLHKLGALYQRTSKSGGDEKWVTNLQAKLGKTVDWESNLDASWNNGQGKYLTKSLVRTSATNKYRTDMDFNSKTMQVKVDMENVPGIKSPVTGKATKIGDNEYEIKLQDATGPNKGTIGFKLTAPNQKFRLETDAFKSSYESKLTDTEWLVGGELVPDPKTKKSYELKFGLKTPNPNARETNFQIGYPERKIDFFSNCKRSLEKIDHSVGINYDVGKREHTVLRYALTRAPNAPSVAELHLTDPKLPQGLHLESKYLRKGNYENEDADFISNNEITLKYSKDPNKQLIITRENKREVKNKRGKISSSLKISHPATNLHHKIWNSYLLEPCDPKAPDCEYTFTLGASYLDQSKTVRQYSVDVKRSNKGLDAGVAFDKNKYALTRQRGGAGQASYTIAKDGKELYQIVGELPHRDQKRPAISLIVNKKPENTPILRASASLDETDFASFKLYHDENGKEIKDVEGIIKLQESNLLQVKYFKRPGLTQAIQSTIDKYVPKQMPTKDELPKVLTGGDSIGKDIAKELQPMLDSWDKDDDQIASELKITSGKLGTALKEQLAAISAAVSQLKSSILSAGRAFRDVFGAYFQALNDIIARIVEASKGGLPAFKGTYDAASKGVDNINKKIATVLNEIYQGANVKALVDPVKKALKDYANAPLYKKFIEILINLRKALSGDQKGAGAVGEFIGKLQAIRQQRYKQLLDLVDQMRKEAAKNPEYKELTDFLNLAYSKLDWLVNYAKPGQQVTDAAGNVYSTLTKPERPQLYNKSADGNTITLSVPLYHNFNSLRDLAKALTPDRIESTFLEIKETVENTLDGVFSGDEERGDIFADSKALAVGEQYYITFDGELRSIASDCTYLLARDFIDSRFSVLVKMEKAARKSIIVQFDDDNFEIDYENAVTINGKPAELPYNSEERGTRSKVNIIREDDYIVTLKTFNGLKIVCNSFNHICSVILKARFRGKTNGLLGQNGGETVADMTLPNGKQASNVDEYMRSWAVQPSCANSPNRANIEKIPENHKAADHCERLFGGNHRRSPYSRCSGLNSNHFSLICQRDMLQFTRKEKDESKHDRGVCQSIAAFLTACDLNIDLPDQCLQCNVGGKPLELHKSVEVSAKDQLKQVDVIFIVDNRECLAPAKSVIGGIAQKVESNLQKGGFNTRFGLVGINGKGLHESPTFHTGKGAVSFGAADLQAAISKFAFDEPALTLKSNLDVLDYITEHYPFRAASRKLLVLFTCSNCVSLELTYYDLQTKLLGQSYSLHVVTTQKIELSGDSKGNFIGFDAHTFFSQDMKEDPKARENLVEPHDSCTVLAQETNGTVFSISDKNNLSPVSAGLAKALTATAEGNECNSCECISHDFFPKTNCMRCHPPKPVALTSDQSGFFNNPFQKIAKLQKKTP